ncbi:MAG: hypothetical protein M1541_03595, partial [Acidobacteria bacterium]|nr:hypothetical protein [Acidobacteriota bacterium]
GAFTEGVAMTGAAQDLADGITITFTATTGHTLGDQWVITVTDLGCWTVNGAGTVNAAIGLTQAITLFELPANGDAERFRIKTNAACSGAATIQVTDIGLTGTPGFYATGLTYDLAAVPGDTNLLIPTMAATGSDTAAATNITATVTTTVNQVDKIAAGCTFDIWVKYGVLP